MTAQAAPADIDAAVAAARAQLDQHAYENIQWHFHESTGCPFWLEKKKELKFDPLTEIKCYEDLKKFPTFEDEWLRGGPVRRWLPKGLEGRPAYVFETGGTTVSRRAALWLTTSASTTKCSATLCLITIFQRVPTG